MGYEDYYWGLYRGYYKDPVPRSLLRTRQSLGPEDLCARLLGRGCCYKQLYDTSLTRQQKHPAKHLTSRAAGENPQQREATNALTAL